MISNQISMIIAVKRHLVTCKNLLVAILGFTLLFVSPSWSNLQSGNEQGLAEGHAFTPTGPGEQVSNLNGNLVLSVPLANVQTSSPISISLERSFNSHWRDPLYAMKTDFVNAGERKLRANTDMIFKMRSQDPENIPFGGIGEVTNYQEYNNETGQQTPTGAATGLALTTGIGAASYKIADAGIRLAYLGQKTPALDAVSSWAGAGFAAASMAIQIYNLNENGFNGSSSVDNFAQLASIGVSAGHLVNSFVHSEALGKGLSVAGLALHAYSAAKWAGESNEWDPGYKYNQYLIPMSLGLDAYGTALLFAPPPADVVGVVCIFASSIMDLTATLLAYHDMEDERMDIRIVRSKPWALSVNGYVGMIGDKKPTDQGTAAYPFGGYESESGHKNFGSTTWFGDNQSSMHPMPDLNLIRSGGGSDRFFLQPFDYATLPSSSGSTDSVRWYSYVASSGVNRTKVYFCDRYPFQYPGSHRVSGSAIWISDDPNDFYLVKESNGTWAKFGMGGTKGIQRTRTGWGDPFETYWALPNSVHHINGDSIKIGYDASLNTVSVKHSKDPRWVRITPSENSELVETVGSNGEVATKVALDWEHDVWSSDRRSVSDAAASVGIFHERFSEKLLRSVTTYPEDTKSLTTKFSWHYGDLVKVEYPNGSYANYEYHDRNVRSSMEGFLEKRTQYSGVIQNAPSIIYDFLYSGWGGATQGESKGGVDGLFTTQVTKKVTAPNSFGSSELSTTSVTNRYQFQYTSGSVNIRDRIENRMPTDNRPDTNMAAYSSQSLAKMRLRTVEVGIDGNGKRTDFVYHGDQLILSLERSGLDTVFAPRLTTYGYDFKGNLVSKRVNPESEMAKLERQTLLILGNGLDQAMKDTSKLDWSQLRSNISATLGKTWKGRFDTLDLNQLYSYQSIDGSELIRDTSYLDRNPYKTKDSLLILSRRDSLAKLGDSVTSYVNDSSCVFKRDSLYRTQTPDCKHAKTSYRNYVITLSGLREAVDSMQAKIDVDSTRWSQAPDSVLVTFAKFNNKFNPYGRYAFLPTGSFVMRKNVDTSTNCGIIGSLTTYDSLLRPVRTDAWRNGPLPGVRYEYGDSKWPYVPTGVRSYVDSSGSQLRYRYNRFVLDPTLGVPTQALAWNRYFTEPKADSLGLPGKDPKAITSAGNPDFTSNFTLDSRARVTRVIGARKDTSEYAYDNYDRIVKSRAPGGAWIKAVYHDVPDANGVIWTEQYRESGVKDIQGSNGLGWPIMNGSVAANGRDSVMAYTGYQVHGLGWQQDAEGRIVRYLYDAQGRPTSVTIVRKDGLLDIFETQYDDFERTSTQIDPLQRKTITWFDIQGNPTKVQRQLDSTGKVVTTLAKYDNLGNLVWSQAPGGDTSHYEYTLANELRYSTNSDHFQTWSKYDWTGSPIRTSRRGVGSGGYGVGGDSSSMSYDGLGRLLSVSVDDNARMGQNLIYDAQGGITDPGMLLGVSRGTGAASGMRYDLRGNMTTRMLTAGIFEGVQSSQNPTDSLQWEYLPDGRPKLQRLPRGARIEYEWDVLDRLGKVRFIDPKGVSHGVVDTFLYRKTGSLDSLRLANGIGEKFGYDSTRGMLTTQRVSSGAHTLGLRRDDYDHAARLQQRTRMDGQETYYGYDNLDRLSTVRYGLGKSNGKSNLSYSWSDNGSMTNLVHDYGQTQWTLGSATGEVATSVGTEDGVSKWGYDWAGRLGNRKWTATSATTDTLTRESRQYAWNASSELERFVRTESVASAGVTRDLFGFAYGDHGLRVGKYRGTVTGTDTAWKLARRSVWDGSDVVADSSAGDSAWHYRIVLGLNAVAEARRDSGNVWHLTYVVSDPVGTPELLLDDSGKVVASYAHDAFGNLEDYQGSRETDFRFGGREWDPDLQAGIFGYRLLDPVMGGFLSTDPMEQFNNNYSYVGGSPLDGVDPWGLYSGEDATSTTNPGTCEEGTTLVRGSVPQTNTEVGRLTPDWDMPMPTQSSGSENSATGSDNSVKSAASYIDQFNLTLNAPGLLFALASSGNAQMLLWKDFSGNTHLGSTPARVGLLRMSGKLTQALRGKAGSILTKGSKFLGRFSLAATAWTSVPVMLNSESSSFDRMKSGMDLTVAYISSEGGLPGAAFGLAYAAITNIPDYNVRSSAMNSRNSVNFNIQPSVSDVLKVRP